MSSGSPALYVLNCAIYSRLMIMSTIRFSRRLDQGVLSPGAD
jgi:hypothetical protein